MVSVFAATSRPALGHFSGGVKRPGCEPDYLSSSVADVNTADLQSSHYLHGVTLN
jgi:hypothetical protein